MLKFLARLIGCSVLLCVLAGLAAAWLTLRPLPMREATIDFDVARGMPMRRVAERVEAAGVEVWPPALTLVARVTGNAARVKAGSYRLDKPVNMWELVALMTTGANAYSDLAIIEGWNFSRLRAALAAHPDLAHDTAALGDAELMAQLGYPGVAPEGMFAPDTYSFSRGASELELLRRAARHQQRVLERAWKERVADLPLRSPYEALILASVVEKETGRGEDRPHVASVFINRLRVGMPLQSDPTVIYGMGSGFDGNLRRRDLRADTAFNSYTRNGLPPTPIAMPGRAALEATLNPAPGSYFYFVARGDGSSAFSRTLDEHNRAVARYQRAGRP
ncbi:MAG: endolytic transglycosylase MltG [Candidatus Dactylopiibacterium sp.]|nr:endolytic transglycosylase MltG [Candidatus Dactylopiibacterium sp.]